MKSALDRTKVVLRHLPPTISQATLLDQIEGTFGGRYNWVSFRPGKSSQKHLSYSRAYIDFKRPEDVIEFAEFFDGHVFVNEKGTQFKVTVEYAPSQRVPKQWSKKDVREGTIHEDSEYLEFLELLAKPVENLPSAEIQLERREAERSGAGKDIPIVTPLMDFVRQKRAAKGGPQRPLPNGKVSRRAGASSTGSPSSASSRRGSGKKRVSTTMYVIRDTAKSAALKDKSTYILVPKQGDKHLSDGNQAFEDESGVGGNNDSGKKKVLLLKGKERNMLTLSNSDSMSQQHSITSSAKIVVGSAALKQNQQHEGSGRIIRSILSNKDLRHQSSRSHSEQQTQKSNLEREKRPPRPLQVQLILKGSNGTPEDKVGGNDLHVSNERHEKRGRQKDRPDRSVWAHRSNGDDESLSSAASSQLDSFKGTHAEMKHDTPNARIGEIKTFGGGRTNHSSDNGFSKHLGRRGSTHRIKEVDGYSISTEGKHPRRSSASVYGSHEKQVWVQKASSGS
ncbi:hypothetical protein L6164_036154 [Bauhinia variegata]|uniref:Uncharacterized protein n=1 Tax=Bauhinia variegata TaxID=167791 RepID=A0ACB9KG54_BAUVA|nr:hypothetical protein L6164_036154 [Bauhinia variegata]